MRTRQQVLGELKSVAATAEQENRGFTPDERARVESLMAEMKSIKAAAADEAKGEQELRDQIKQLGDDIGVPGGSSSRHPSSLPGKVKASGGSGGWAKSWMTATQHAGKSLLTPGTVPVSVPLNPDPVRDAEPVLSLRQVIPSVGNSTGHYSYLRQTERTNNAATVAAGTQKPRSTYKLDRVDGRVRTVAHVSEPMHRNDLADAPNLVQFLEVEMRLGFELALENEIFNGDGTPAAGTDPMTGMLSTSGIQVQAFDTDRLTSLRRAIGKLENIGYTAGAIAMRPATWEEIELTTAGTNEAYALDRAGDRLPVDRAARRVWGVPVVLSLSAPATGAAVWDTSALRLHLREEGQLTMSDGLYDPDLHGAAEGGNYFEANLVAFRFEGRADLEVSKPKGVVEVALAV